MKMEWKDRKKKSENWTKKIECIVDNLKRLRDETHSVTNCDMWQYEYMHIYVTHSHPLNVYVPNRRPFRENTYYNDNCIELIVSFSCHRIPLPLHFNQFFSSLCTPKISISLSLSASLVYPHNTTISQASNIILYSDVVYD